MTERDRSPVAAREGGVTAESIGTSKSGERCGRGTAHAPAKTEAGLDPARIRFTALW